MRIEDILSLRGGSTPPMIMQTETSECGLACLAMISGFFGRHETLMDMRARYHNSARGLTLQRLNQIASDLGLVATPLRVELEFLSELHLPCMLHWNMNHYVVLTKVDAKGVVIHDPSAGEVRLSMEEVSKRFTGVCVEYAPDNDFQEKEKAAGPSILSLFKGVRGLRAALTSILGMAFVLELFGLIMPLATQWTLDRVVSTSDINLLAIIAFALLLLLLFQTAITAARKWAIIRLSTSIQLQWNPNLFNHLVRLPAEYFYKRHLGDITSRFQSADQIQNTLTTMFVETILDGLLSVGTLILMFFYSPMLAGIALLIVCLYMIIRIVSYAPLRKASEDELHYQAQASTKFLETLRGIQTIKLACSENDRRNVWYSSYVRSIDKSVSQERITLYTSIAQQLLFGLENIILLYLGIMLVVEGTFTIGMYFAFTAYKGQFSSHIGPLIDKVVQYRMLSVHLERLQDITETKREEGIDEVEKDGWWLSKNSSEISLKNVSFRYGEGEPLIVNNLTLQVKPGESVAIVGATGRGKTTILKLMLGLLKPIEGDILYGGQSVETIGLRTFRQGISTVMQDDQLFSGSLAENISGFNTDGKMVDIEEAARLAGIDSDINAMPMKYETLVGDIGSSLSGGQKQRVILARALFKKPKILFLDEATSHLDINTERLVNTNVKNLDITRVIIAHRPETINSVDRVIEL